MTQMARTTQSSLPRKPVRLATTVCMHKSQHRLCLNGYIRELFGQLAALDHNGGVMSVTIKEIEQAYSELATQVVRTPLLHSPRLDALAGRRHRREGGVPAAKPVASNMGASHALNSLSSDEKANGVIAYSSGNHAQGIARLESGGIRPPSSCPTMPRKTNLKPAAMAPQSLPIERRVESREAIGDSIATRDGLTLSSPMTIVG